MSLAAPGTHGSQIWLGSLDWVLLNSPVKLCWGLLLFLSRRRMGNEKGLSHCKGSESCPHWTNPWVWVSEGVYLKVWLTVWNDPCNPCWTFFFFLRPERKWSFCCAFLCINMQLSVSPDWHTCINSSISSVLVQKSLWLSDTESKRIWPGYTLLPSQIWNNLQNQTTEKSLSYTNLSLLSPQGSLIRLSRIMFHFLIKPATIILPLMFRTNGTLYSHTQCAGKLSAQSSSCITMGLLEQRKRGAAKAWALETSRAAQFLLSIPRNFSMETPGMSKVQVLSSSVGCFVPLALKCENRKGAN